MPTEDISLPSELSSSPRFRNKSVHLSTRHAQITTPGFWNNVKWRICLIKKHILTFMGTLQVRTKWNYQSWIRIFQIKFLFLVLSFWKRIDLVYFLKTDWSYTFLKVKNSNQNFNLKKVLKCLKFGLSCGKNGRYALCDAFYTCF